MADEPIDLAAAHEKTLEAIRKEYPPLLTSGHVAELMQCTIWEVRDQVPRRVPGRALGSAVPLLPRGGPGRSPQPASRPGQGRVKMAEESPEITYEKWYPDVPPVMDSQEVADLLSASDQVIRTWAREGVIPAHRAPGARKFRFLRHEIFQWLVENRYEPKDGDQAST